MELARRIGIEKDRAEKLVTPFLLKQAGIEGLVKRSFLDEPTRRGYLLEYNRKRNHLIKE